MPPTTDHGNATPPAAAWLACDPASSLRLALDVLAGNFAPQAQHLLHWALGHLRNVVVLRGHADWVMSAGFIADGQFVFTASLDHTVRIWATATGEQHASFNIGAPVRFLSGAPQVSANGALLLVVGFDGLVHAGPWQGADSLPVLPVSVDVRVNRAAIAADNDHILTGHANGTVRVSSLSTPDDVIVLAGTPDEDPIACVAFSPDRPDGPDDRYAAVGTRTGNIRLWNLARPGRPVVLPAHADWVNTVEFSHDNLLLASSSDDKTARLFSVPEGRLVAALRTHTDRVIGAGFSHQDELVVTAGVDKTARLFETRTGDQRAVIQGVGDEVQSAAFSPDDRLVAVASVDGTCRICYTHNGSTLFELQDHNGPVYTIAFNAAGNSVVTASADRTARLWDVDIGHVFWGHHGQVNTAVFSHDGRYVATACEDGAARVFETAGGSQVAVVAGHEGAVNGAAFNCDGTLLLTVGQDSTAQVAAWQTADAPVVLHHDLEVDAGAFSFDGNRVITSTSREAVLWQWRTGERLTTFTSSPEERAVNLFIAIIGVDLSPDASRVVTAHYDQHARLWDAATGAQLRALEHAGIVYKAVFSYDGAQVITASGDGHVRVWDTVTGGLLHELVGPSRQLRCAAFSPDGRWAAAGDDEGGVTIWNVADEQVAAVLQQHTETVMSVVFRADGAALLTASDDGTAKAAAIDSFRPLEEVVTMARQRADLATRDP
jgi:WD40 repeat protein